MEDVSCHRGPSYTIVLEEPLKLMWVWSPSVVTIVESSFTDLCVFHIGYGLIPYLERGRHTYIYYTGFIVTYKSKTDKRHGWEDGNVVDKHTTTKRYLASALYTLYPFYKY